MPNCRQNTVNKCSGDTDTQPTRYYHYNYLDIIIETNSANQTNSTMDDMRKNILINMFVLQLYGRQT